MPDIAQQDESVLIQSQDVGLYVRSHFRLMTNVPVDELPGMWGSAQFGGLNILGTTDPAFTPYYSRRALSVQEA